MGNSHAKEVKKQHSEKLQAEQAEIEQTKGKRLRINQEVVDTERSYNNTLEGCIQNVVIPLRNRTSVNEISPPKLSKEEIRQIFTNLETLSEMHRNFLEELVSLLAQSDPLFGPLFVKYVCIVNLRIKWISSN